MSFEEKYNRVMEGVKEETTFPKVMHGVGGMLYRPEAHWLHRVPAIVGDGVYVELGTHHGRSAVLLGDGMKQNALTSQLITIDSYDDRGLSKRFRSKEKRVGAKFENVKGLLQEKGLLAWVTPVCGLTAEVAWCYEPDTFDFLFIDAGHDYKNVKADWEAWSPLVKDTGIIAFHDSHEPDILRVLNEVEGWYEFDRVNTLSVWRKNGVSRR